MKRMKIGVLLLGTAMSAACGGNVGDQTASNEVVVADNMPANEGMAMTGPFAEAEMRMNEQMMAAVGSDAGQNWLKKMIVHHQGAIDMSRVVLEQNPTADVARMARETITKQGKEIEDLRKLVQEGAPDQRSAELYRPAMMDMHDKMMAASGSNISETYMRKMLEHHRGAVAMSDVALANGVTGAIRDKVQKTRSEQQKEIAMVEAMLRGEPMAEAKEEPAKAPTTAPAAERRTAPATPPKASAEPPRQPTAPRPPAAPAPASQADPHAGHDMNKM